jgi:hypothetical protein
MIKNLYTNGFLLIFKLYFHNIGGASCENHRPRMLQPYLDATFETGITSLNKPNTGSLFCSLRTDRCFFG